jgi:hypothetical protein
MVLRSVALGTNWRKRIVLGWEMSSFECECMGREIWGMVRMVLVADFQKIVGFGGIGCRCCEHRSLD